MAPWRRLRGSKTIQGVTAGEGGGVFFGAPDPLSSGVSMKPGKIALMGNARVAIFPRQFFGWGPPRRILRQLKPRPGGKVVLLNPKGHVDDVP
ncbi:MAG: hypothetical protein CM15mP74_08670 [Halieaceae bacterium]|nr:MAG: hypothetical protein CM15mP74_08670 [Halieaceae bacterium]